MANRTDPLARQVHGSNPQFLMEKILRLRIYANRYWKEQCFGLTAETLIDRAVKLEFIGGSSSHNVKPTPFMCLLLKLLQIQPEMDVVFEYIKQEDYKYLRALGAFYVRLVARPAEVYKYLEPLLEDYSKLAKRTPNGWELIHMDEYIDELLTSELCCDVTLPVLQKRSVLEASGAIDPRESSLDEALEEDEPQSAGTRQQPQAGAGRVVGPAARAPQDMSDDDSEADDEHAAAARGRAGDGAAGGAVGPAKRPRPVDDDMGEDIFPSGPLRAAPGAAAPVGPSARPSHAADEDMEPSSKVLADPQRDSTRPEGQELADRDGKRARHDRDDDGRDRSRSGRDDDRGRDDHDEDRRDGRARDHCDDDRHGRDRDGSRERDRYRDRGGRDGRDRYDGRDDRHGGHGRDDRYRDDRRRDERDYRDRDYERRDDRRYDDRDRGYDRDRGDRDRGYDRDRDRAGRDDRRDDRREYDRGRDDHRAGPSGGYGSGQRGPASSASGPGPSGSHNGGASGHGQGGQAAAVPAKGRRNEFGEYVDRSGRPLNASSGAGGASGVRGPGGPASGHGGAGGAAAGAAADENSVEYWNAMRAKLGLKPLK